MPVWSDEFPMSLSLPRMRLGGLLARPDSRGHAVLAETERIRPGPDGYGSMKELILRLEIDLHLEVQCRNISIFALTCF